MNSVSRLCPDLVITMPPEPFEYQGPDAIGAFLAQQAFTAREELVHRLVPTRANGQPAYGHYVADPHAPLARAVGLIVLTLEGDRIAHLTRFAGGLRSGFRARCRGELSMLGRFAASMGPDRRASMPGGCRRTSGSGDPRRGRPPGFVSTGRSVTADPSSDGTARLCVYGPVGGRRPQIGRDRPALCLRAGRWPQTPDRTGPPGLVATGRSAAAEPHPPSGRARLAPGTPPQAAPKCAG
jgi:hypothetical protein